MIKRLIFDVDGTLIPGVKFDRAIKQSLIDYGVYSEKNMKNMNDAMDEYDVVYDSYTKKDYIDFLSKKTGLALQEYFLEIHFKNLEIYSVLPRNDKLIKTIEELSKKYELILLSNYFEEAQRKRLEAMGINKYFSEYYGEKISKPDKKAFLEAIGKCKPKECIMIGDNIDLDIKAALSINMNTIWVNNNKMKTEIKTKEIKNVTEINDELVNSFEKEGSFV